MSEESMTKAQAIDNLAVTMNLLGFKAGVEFCHELSDEDLTAFRNCSAVAKAKVAMGYMGTKMKDEIDEVMAKYREILLDDYKSWDR